LQVFEVGAGADFTDTEHIGGGALDDLDQSRDFLLGLGSIDGLAIDVAAHRQVVLQIVGEEAGFFFRCGALRFIGSFGCFFRLGAGFFCCGSEFIAVILPVGGGFFFAARGEQQTEKSPEENRGRFYFLCEWVRNHYLGLVLVFLVVWLRFFGG